MYLKMKESNYPISQFLLSQLNMLKIKIKNVNKISNLSPSVKNKKSNRNFNSINRSNIYKKNSRFNIYKNNKISRLNRYAISSIVNISNKKKLSISSKINTLIMTNSNN